MSVTLTAPEQGTEPAALLRKWWTREEVDALEVDGYLEPERYELVEGQIIQKMSKNPPHGRAMTRLLLWLTRTLGELVIADTSIDVSPGDIPTSRPEPDLIVLTHSIDEVSTKISAAEIRMVVEISDSTLAFDSRTKASLYARAEIPEYWVVDINARRIIIHREPSEGRYRSLVAYAEDELVSCLAAADVRKRVGELL